MAKADMFLKLTGQKTGAVTGESNVQGHVGEIEILGWSWGMKSAGPMGGGGPSAKTSLNEMHVYKGADSATTQLMNVMRNNELIKEARITSRKAGVIPPVDYLVITLLRGRITNYDIGSETPGLPELREKVSISFEQIDITYAGQDDKGGKKAGSTFQAQVNTA